MSSPMTPTEQDKELQNWLVEHTALIEETGGAVWRELEVETFMYHLRELITADRKRVALEAQLGMIEYYDQAPTNESCNWKGLLSDNRKQIEYELSQLTKELEDD